MCTYIEYSFFSNRVSLIDCCVQECSFCCWYFSSKLDSKVISIGFLNEKSSILFLVGCKAGKFCWGCDQFGLLTDRELGRVKKMILREKLTPCLPFLHITFGSRFKKKRKKKRLLCRVISLYMSTTSRYLFNALFQSTVTPTLICQIHLISLHPVCC